MARRVISFLVAAALFATGAYILGAQIINGSLYGAALLLGGFLTAVGAAWLYSEVRGE